MTAARHMTPAGSAFDVIIVGAGAAGLMCALTAGERGRKVLLLDHADRVGAKILISGGGRCNFTNLYSAPDRFLSGNPDFCRSALGRYTQADFIALVERHRIPYYEKTLGQLFCTGTGSARAIVAMLLAECAQGGVDVRVGHTVTDISRPADFRLETSHGCFTAPALVLATGGLSIPKMGATGFAHEVARRFGLRVTQPLPGLVPLKATPETLGFDQMLAGVSLEAIVSCAGQSFRENILFTHHGVSGPAVLQISSYWRQGHAIWLDLLPDLTPSFLQERKRSRPRAEAKTVLAEILPARLAQALAQTCLPPGPMANLSDRTLAAFAARLKHWEVQPTGSEGWPKAEVTLGGIDTRDLSSKSMAALNVPGLYAIGEALDVTGWLGGYNFQWAWSSGWCAGQAV
jgi:predicted Rossmann fold flavoprotein